MADKKLKVLSFKNCPSPYMIPYYNMLLDEFDLNTLFMTVDPYNAKWKGVLEPAKFKYEFMKTRYLRLKFGIDYYDFYFGSGIKKYLKEFGDFDCFICSGWNSISTYLALKYCKKHKIPFIIFNESTSQEKSLRRTLFLPYIKYIIRSADACLVAGSRAKKFDVMMGANPKDVFVQGYCVDNNKFISATALLKKDINLKEKLGFNKNSKLVLYVGQIIKRKGIDNLFEIFTEFNNEGENIELVLLGTGPLEEYYKKQIVQNGIKNIHFKGFIQQDEILKYYAIADAFVLPSYEETWGLVVNEAMCAALPVIVSKRAGSSEDLVKHGKNGFVFDPNKKNELKSYILRICNNDSLKYQMGKVSLEIIKKQSPENTALMISRCIRHAITKVKKD